MVCLRNISVDTLYKGDAEDNNINNNKKIIIIVNTKTFHNRANAPKMNLFIITCNKSYISRI